MNTPDTQAKTIKARIKRKPFLCAVIQLSALTYFLILALLFLSGAIFSGKIVEIITPYYGAGDSLPGNFIWIALGSSSVYFIAVAGLLMFIYNKKAGFYIFFVASLVIFSLDLSLLIFDWLRYLIHTGFIFMLGIAHFSKKCYC